MKDAAGAVTPCLQAAISDPHPRVRWAAVNGMLSPQISIWTPEQTQLWRYGHLSKQSCGDMDTSPTKAVAVWVPNHTQLLRP